MVKEVAVAPPNTSFFLSSSCYDVLKLICCGDFACSGVHIVF